MVSGHNFPEDTREDKIIKQILSRLEDLERGNRAGSTSIDNGALEVRQDGQTRVKVGELDDGSYGMAMYNDAGVALPLSQLAFGVKAESISTLRTATLNAWTNIEHPAVDVEITTGRAIVIVSGWLHVYDALANAGSPTTTALSYVMDHETEGRVVDLSTTRAVAVESLSGQGMRGNYNQASFAYAHKDLPNGTYSVATASTSSSIGAFPYTGETNHRSLIVLPY